MVQTAEVSVLREQGDTMGYTLYHGDCLTEMKNIADGSVDMILADLPYGVTRNDWDVKIPMQPMWEEFRRICKPNAAIVLTAQQPFASELVQSNPKEFKYEWVWEKSCAGGFLNAKKRPLAAHENVLVFYRKQPTYNPEMRKGKPIMKNTAGGQSTNYNGFDRKPYLSDTYYPRSVIRFSNAARGGAVILHKSLLN